MSNYKVITQPAKWVSAHRKNEYTMRLPQSAISSGYNNGGYLKLNLSGALPFPINVGDRLYIPAGTDYTGFHTIKEIDSNIQFTLNTLYTSNISGSVVIWQCELPEIEIYKGYSQGEIVLTYDDGTIDLYDIMPRTLVATFKPEVNMDGYLQFDLCGYLKTVIEAPYKPAYNPDEESFLYPVSLFSITFLTYLPKYYNKVSLILSKWNFGNHYVANSAITTEELNRDFVDTERQLCVLTQPVRYFNQFTLGDYINNNLLTAKLK